MPKPQRARRPSLAVQNELETLIQKYLTYLLERGLNSPGFIKQIKNKQLLIDADIKQNGREDEFVMFSIARADPLNSS